MLGLLLLCCSCAGQRPSTAYVDPSLEDLHITQGDVLVSLPDTVMVNRLPLHLAQTLCEQYNCVGSAIMRSLAGYLSGRVGFEPVPRSWWEPPADTGVRDSVRLGFLALSGQRGQSPIERCVTYTTDFSGVTTLEVLSPDSLVSHVRIWNRRFLFLVHGLTLTGRKEEPPSTPTLPPSVTIYHVPDEVAADTPFTYMALTGQAFLWDTESRSLKWSGVIAGSGVGHRVAAGIAWDLAAVVSSTRPYAR